MKPTPPSTPRSLRVIVADDAELVRSHLVEMLRGMQGVEVCGEATTIPEVIEQVRALRPDAVVLDISMPGGNGITALQQIKQELPGTNVIMLTNHSNDFYRRRCLHAGASFFFDKSSEFDQVPQALQRIFYTA